MKLSAQDLRNHLWDFMDHMGYPDLWMRISRLPVDNGTNYMEYVLLYFDDCLVVSQHPKEALMKLGKYFLLKQGSVGSPKLYLDLKL